ncbi:MAG: 2-amino-4-hydroxy-6-hydroxymethyldihydropteridine diphosphokinase [Chloroflexi bacterium RBG_19FT_COMBO_49_13]|nr:MAG: 2-amino-4-hydroxy-6-hydroxymethyldihydropteridine diphosphokinase [Chloroflexi bacterium RBG_19FT_COMBO_49_13]
MSTVIHQACLLLGSNIEPELNIPRAVDLLRQRLTILHVSSVWESASVDCCYPDYLNMAVMVSTPLDAAQLKEQVLRPLEAQMGRVRTEDKHASRPIDLDVILFDGAVLDPALWQQAHLAVTVAELLPDFRTDTGEALKDIAERLAHATPVQIRVDISISLPGAG